MNDDENERNVNKPKTMTIKTKNDFRIIRVDSFVRNLLSVTMVFGDVPIEYIKSMHMLVVHHICGLYVPWITSLSIRHTEKL